LSEGYARNRRAESIFYCIYRSIHVGFISAAMPSEEAAEAQALVERQNAEIG